MELDEVVRRLRSINHVYAWADEAADAVGAALRAQGNVPEIFQGTTDALAKLSINQMGDSRE